MAQKLNELALGYAAAGTSGLGMLLLGILANLGIYVGAAEQMQKWHLFFNLSVVGIIGGIIEASIISFIFAWIFAKVYNKFA